MTLDYCVQAFDIGHDMVQLPGKYNQYSDIGKPLIGHEFGNWNTFPLLESLFERFHATSNVKPYWLEPPLQHLKDIDIGLLQENERYVETCIVPIAVRLSFF